MSEKWIKNQKKKMKREKIMKKGEDFEICEKILEL